MFVMIWNDLVRLCSDLLQQEVYCYERQPKDRPKWYDAMNEVGVGVWGVVADEIVQSLGNRL